MTNRNIDDTMAEVKSLMIDYKEFDSIGKEGVDDRAINWAYEDGKHWDDLSPIEELMYTAIGVKEYLEYCEDMAIEIMERD